jgi:hypothetical protein
MRQTSKEYRLITGKTPPTHVIATRHSNSRQLQWWDEEKGNNRAIRYLTNHPNIFEDEQPTEGIKLGRIYFEDGMLTVPNKNKTLQTFLAHHPDNRQNGGGIFEMINPETVAKAVVEDLDMSFEAQKISRELSPKELEAVLRKLKGKKVDDMYSEEIKRDVRLFAKNDPEKFLSMIDMPEVETDNNLANIINEGLIQFRKNDSEVYYNLPDSKKMLFRVPEGKNPMEALEEYLTTDNEGIQKYKELLDILEN